MSDTYKMSIYADSAANKTHQSDYDHFNGLIFSRERNIMFKLLMRHRLYEMVKYLHGDIVECGVFKGSGLASWLKMMDMDAPHDIRKVIGFDFYDPEFTKDLTGEDKIYMEQVFKRCQINIDDSATRSTSTQSCSTADAVNSTSTNPHCLSEVSVEFIQQRLINAGVPEYKFELVKGDVSLTSKGYVKTRPGFRISLLYMDLDIERPTYEALVNFWDNIVPGGIVVFDEYAYHVWSEANAVDKFVKEKGLTLHKLDIRSPTAYIVK